MKHIYLFLFIIFFILNDNGFSQGGLINIDNTIKISSGTSIIIDGDLTNNNLGRIENDGDIIVSGDLYNNASNQTFVSNNDTGYVILNGTTQQRIGGSGNSFSFENLYINNTSADGVEILNNNQYIENQLILNDGILSTNLNSVVILNPDSSSLINFSDTSFINGNLRRYIASNTETYSFPLGNGLNGTNYYLAELINNNITGASYIDGSFEPLTNHNDADMIAQETSSMSYNSLATEGVWNLTPDTTVLTGSYDLKTYIGNIAGLIDNRFAILTRPNNSLTAADWTSDPSGIGNPGINDINGNGRLLSDGYALRMGYTHFSQFGIGIIACPLPQLFNDTNICNGDSIVLYPGEFSTYSWSTGSTDSAIVVNSADEYFVVVTSDFSGCGSSSDTINIGFVQIDYTTNVQDVSCFGYNDGQISISPTGGTPTYHYSWSPSEPDSNLITGLSPISFAVTITDANGCSVSIPKIQINEPDSLYLSASISNNLCYGDSSGGVIVTAIGGTPDYSYLWSNGDQTGSLSNVQTGNYILTLTDANGCQFTSSYDLTSVTSPITITADTGVDENYYGYIHTSVQGGTPGYNYAWDYDNLNNSADADYLSSGTYTLTVSDFNNCMTVDTFTIEIPLIIPTIITPNEDGINDTWEIINIDAYNDVRIQIYNRWGNILYLYEGTGIGYRNNKTIQWDGTYNGKKLPLSSYVYIIELNDNAEQFNGVVTIKY